MWAAAAAAEVAPTAAVVAAPAAVADALAAADARAAADALAAAPRQSQQRGFGGFGKASRAKPPLLLF